MSDIVPAVDPEILGLLNKVFRMDLMAVKNPVPYTALWGGCLRYNHKFKQVVFSIDDYEHKEHWCSQANELLAASIGTKDKAEYIQPMRDAQTGRLEAVLDLANLRMLAEETGGKVRAVPGRCIERLYGDYVVAELRRLALSAFNIDPHEGYEDRNALDDNDDAEEQQHRWEHARITFDSIGFTDDETGEESHGWGMYFTRFGEAHNPVQGMKFLAEDIEDAFVRIWAHLDDDLRQSMLSADGTNPLARIRYENSPYDFFSGVIDMGCAKKMSDAGLCVDLRGIVEFHMNAQRHKHVDDSADVRKAFLNRMSLQSYPNNRYASAIKFEGRSLIGIDGRREGSNSFDGMTGFCLEKGEGFKTKRDAAGKKVFAPLDCPYDVVVSPGFLKFAEIETFAADMNALTGSDAFRVEKHGGDYAIKSGYAQIEKWIRAGTVFDAKPVFDKWLAVQRGRVVESHAAVKSLNDTFGYHAWYDFGFFSQIFTPSLTGFSMRFERHRRTTRDDHPEAQTVFTENAARLQDVLQHYCLMDDVKHFGSGATRMAGGQVFEYIGLDLKPVGLDGLIDVAERFAIAKDEMRTVVAAILKDCTVHQTLGERLFNHPAPKTPQHERMVQAAYGPGILERMRHGPEVSDDDVYDRNPRMGRATSGMAGYVAYFVEAAQQGETPEIRAAAAKQLSDLKPLIPVLETMIEEARRDLAAKQLSGSGIKLLPAKP